MDILFTIVVDVGSICLAVVIVIVIGGLILEICNASQKVLKPMFTTGVVLLYVSLSMFVIATFF